MLAQTDIASLSLWTKSYLKYTVTGGKIALYFWPTLYCDIFLLCIPKLRETEFSCKLPILVDKCNNKDT